MNDRGGAVVEIECKQANACHSQSFYVDSHLCSSVGMALAETRLKQPLASSVVQALKVTGI